MNNKQLTESMSESESRDRLLLLEHERKNKVLVNIEES